MFAQTWSIATEFADYIVPDSDAETHYAALIRCQDDIVINIERGEYMSTQTGPISSWEVIGSRGALRMDMLQHNPCRIEHTYITDEGLQTEAIYEQVESAYCTPIEDFARAIREDQQPKTSLENSLIVQQITDGIYDSADQRTEISIE